MADSKPLNVLDLVRELRAFGFLIRDNKAFSDSLRCLSLTLPFLEALAKNRRVFRDKKYLRHIIEKKISKIEQEDRIVLSKRYRKIIVDCALKFVMNAPKQ